MAAHLDVQVQQGISPDLLRPVQPTSDGSLHLDVLCVLPSITRGLRPSPTTSRASSVAPRHAGSSTRREPPTAGSTYGFGSYSMASGSGSDARVQAPMPTLPSRREMTAALADASNSLNPGRRSSITTLMPTSSVYASALSQQDASQGMALGQAGSSSRSAVSASERILANVLDGNDDDSTRSSSPTDSPKPIYKRSHTASHPLLRSVEASPTIDLSDDQDGFDSLAASQPASPRAAAAPFGSRSRPRPAGGDASVDPGRSAAPPTARPSRRPQTSHNAGISGDRPEVTRFGSSSGSRAVRPPAAAADEYDPARRSLEAMSSSSRAKTKRPGTSDGGPSAIRSRPTGSGRPGWEGDEVVHVLREDGVQVTTLRSASQLQPHLRNLALAASSSSVSASTSAPSSSAPPSALPLPDALPPRTPTPKVATTQIILIPLSDSPTLPSLSLLLAQGTTPSAVCFQQDLLDRARRTEEDWLPSALDMIALASQAPISSTSASAAGQPPLVIAYSANPALSESVVVRCIQAGAIGVLQPPYDVEDTLGRIEGMVKIYLGGLGADGVARRDDHLYAPGGPSRSRKMSVASSLEQVQEDPDPDLAGDPAHRPQGSTPSLEPPPFRRQSSAPSCTPNGHASAGLGDDDLAEPTDPLMRTSSSGDGAAGGAQDGQARATLEPVAAPVNSMQHASSSKTGQVPSHSPYLIRHHLQSYNFDARRRSVDTGGLALALERAAKRFQASDDVPPAQSQANGQDLPRRASHWEETGINVPHDQGQRVPGEHVSPKKPKSAASSPGPAGMASRDQAGQPPNGSSPAKRAKRSPADGGQADADGEDSDGRETALAELLGEMFRQTRLAVEITMADYPALAAPLEPEHRARLLNQLASWNFKPHVLDEGDLFRCACILFDAVLRIDGLAQLGIPRDQMNRYLFAVRAIYHAPNPYHNYIHAIDVLQASYTFLLSLGVVPPFDFLLADSGEPWLREPVSPEAPQHQQISRVQDLIRPQEVWSVMIAAMGHDIGHPGLSNAFMKNAKTPLSQLYDDKSVLENMHCSLIVQLLRKHGFGMFLDQIYQPQSAPSSVPTTPMPAPTPLSATFPNIPSEMTALPKDPQPGAILDWRGFRKILYATVVSTDMSLHFSWIQEFRDLGKRLRDWPSTGAVDSAEDASAQDEADRTIICQAIMKCADISNPTRPIEVSEHWSSVLLQEWALQASLESRLELPISVVSSANAALQAKGQIGFIDLFTAPLFEAAAEAMPTLQYFATQCSDNRALWEERLAQATAEAEEAAQRDAGGSSAPNGSAPVKRSLPDNDERFKTLFPLSLPTSLLSQGEAQREVPTGPSPSTPSTASSAQSRPAQPTRKGSDPAAQAVRAVYLSNVKRQPSSPKIKLERQRSGYTSPTATAPGGAGFLSPTRTPKEMQV